MESIANEKEEKKRNNIWHLFEEAQRSMFGLLSSARVTLYLHNGGFILAGNMLCLMIVVQISCI